MSGCYEVDATRSRANSSDTAERLAGRVHLLVALMLAIMREGDQRRAAGDGRRLVERGIGQRQAVAADLVAIGVIGEGGVDDAAGDR